MEKDLEETTRELCKAKVEVQNLKEFQQDLEEERAVSKELRGRIEDLQGINQEMIDQLKLQHSEELKKNEKLLKMNEVVD